MFGRKNKKQGSYRHCPFADLNDSSCPLFADGPGLVVEVAFLDGKTVYLPFAQGYPVEHFPGVEMKLIEIDDAKSTLMTRQKDPGRVIVPWHRHNNSSELLIVTSGTVIYATGEDAKNGRAIQTGEKELRPGDSVLAPAGQLHRVQFIPENGELAETITIWRPPMTEVTVNETYREMVEASESGNILCGLPAVPAT